MRCRSGQAVSRQEGSTESDEPGPGSIAIPPCRMQGRPQRKGTHVSTLSGHLRSQLSGHSSGGGPGQQQRHGMRCRMCRLCSSSALSPLSGPGRRPLRVDDCIGLCAATPATLPRSQLFDCKNSWRPRLMAARASSATAYDASLAESKVYLRIAVRQRLCAGRLRPSGGSGVTPTRMRTTGRTLIWQSRPEPSSRPESSIAQFFDYLCRHFLQVCHACAHLIFHYFPNLFALFQSTSRRLDRGDLSAPASEFSVPYWLQQQHPCPALCGPLMTLFSMAQAGPFRSVRASA